MNLSTRIHPDIHKSQICPSTPPPFRGVDRWTWTTKPHVRQTDTSSRATDTTPTTSERPSTPTTTPPDTSHEPAAGPGLVIPCVHTAYMRSVGTRRATRERHEQAAFLRGCGYTWSAIAEHLGYRTRSGAQSAVERLWARQRETPELARRSLAEGLNVTKSTLFESLADAKRRGDVAAITACSREIRSVTDQLAKLDGLHAAQRVDVNVAVTPTRELLAQYRTHLLNAIDAEVVETREIES